jgi:hypothetical protein
MQEHNNSKKQKNTLKQLSMPKNHDKMDYLVDEHDNVLGLQMVSQTPFSYLCVNYSFAISSHIKFN